MKKWFGRIIGAICILASVATMFCATYVQIDDVRTKAFRETKELVFNDLDAISNRFNAFFSSSVAAEELKEELKDNDLPYTKTSVKKRIKEIRGILGDLIDEKISFGELLKVSMQAPQYVEDLANVMCSDRLRATIMGMTHTLDLAELEDTIEEVNDYTWCFYLLSAVLIGLAILGVAAAVFNVIGKARSLKYIYLVVLVLLTAGIVIGLNFANELIQDVPNITEAWEDASFKITVMPFVAIVLAAVPCVLSIFSKKQKKELT